MASTSHKGRDIPVSDLRSSAVPLRLGGSMFSLLSLLLLLQCADDALALHAYILSKAALPLHRAVAACTRNFATCLARSLANWMSARPGGDWPPRVENRDR